MLIIGEKLNSAIPSVRQMIAEKDKAAVQELALKQVEMGADYLDINTAQNDEIADMEWMVNVVQEVTDVPLCIDSTSAPAIKKGMETIKGDKSRAMINSISMESNRINEVVPLALEYNCPVIGLTADDTGIPKTTEDRIRIAEEMVNLLSKKNYDLAKLYIDPLVLPVSVDHNNAKIFFEAIGGIKEKLQIKTVSGLSNISYGMPKRKIINRYFLSICMVSGMDAAILDPIDGKIRSAILATELLMGNDRFGKNYLKAHRKDSLVD